MDLGITYKNRDSACNFVHYIAESQRREFHVSLASYHFYSVLIDGSIDKDRVENELFVILFCKRDDTLQEVNVSDQSMYLIRMACEVSFKLLFLGCTGPGATLTGLNLHAKMLFPVVSSMTLMKCC